MTSNADGSCATKSPEPMEEDVTDEDSYKMNHNRRGKAVIFNHQNFMAQDGETKLPKKERDGTTQDKEQLVETLKAMGWHIDDIIVREDQRIDQIKKTMNELTTKDAESYHQNADCILVVVLTHGGNDGMLRDSEMNMYNESELWEPFVGVQSLAGKPKILIKQACRGIKVDEGVSIRGDEGISSEMKIPEQADFLIYRSTPENYGAWRDFKTGSVFIQSLCEVLKARNDKDFLTLCTRVNRKVAETDITKNGKSWQIPEIYSRLTKDIFFNKK